MNEIDLRKIKGEIVTSDVKIKDIADELKLTPQVVS